MIERDISTPLMPLIYSRDKKCSVCYTLIKDDAGREREREREERGERDTGNPP